MKTPASNAIDHADTLLPLADTAPGSDTAPGLHFPLRAWAPHAVAAALAGLCLGTLLGMQIGPSREQDTHHATPTASDQADATDTGTRIAGTVGALGRLMPEGDIITLAMPYGAGDARVARWLVQEGYSIRAGQIIAELDNLPQRQAVRDTARAQLEARQAATEEARSAARQGWMEAQASARRARAVQLEADQNLARMLSLVDEGVSTRAQVDTARAAADAAASEWLRAEAALDRHHHRDTNEQPEVRLALANLGVAQAALAQAEQDLAAARVTAPLDGEVLSIHARVGEKPGDRGLATLGNVDRMAAELEVYQTDVRRVVVGQKVVLTSLSLGVPLTGRIVQIGREVQRQATLASDPVSSTDARVVKVTALLDSASSKLTRALTGLQVMARISVTSP